MNEDVEFNANKQAANQIKHNHISFLEADSVLDDLFSITKEDYGDHAEARYFTLGMSNRNRLLVVVWTIRGDNVRVISARLAEPHQRKTYEQKR